MLFVGVDWAEVRHDVCVLDVEGRVLGRRKIDDSLAGVGDLHELVAKCSHDNDPEIVVGIEKDRGLIVTALVASGYSVFAINPMAAARYRERHHVSGAKSDPGDAKVLADLVRTDRHNHRRVAGDSNLAEAVKVLARAHQNAIWTRQRHVNALRSAMVDYFPGALEAFGNNLADRDALSVLAIAPTPALASLLSHSKLVATLRRGGRKRYLEEHADELQLVLRKEQLRQPTVVEDAYGLTTKATVGVLIQLNATVKELEAGLAEHFEQHPDAKIIRSLPGMGTVLGARVLGEFGDDPNRYSDLKSRRNNAGTSPVTRASGKSKVVLARHGRNRRLGEALERMAFSSITASPGARAYYDLLRSREKTHQAALRQLANRWVGILHTCLERQCLYDEQLAWPTKVNLAA